ncbi:hypothetical protein AAT19DRAFT_16269 [Rhodotorula toruloides]|uniref:FCP1 homology domain-containing protein n=1 Tax=Rhodotorula toruloides TaxID=5286 RepID=A0A2T0A6H8_RHOTO|nr:hypothetical protein AAT19DRAFT_16269 [Rhodotorula toruloides]
MPTGPSYAYTAEVGVPSRVLSVKEVEKQRPLVVFDLGGTLYCRPPQNLEHMPDGEPAGRPYLRTFLSWLMRDESPWSVVIWTGSQKATAISCLYALDLGLVGPSLTPSGDAEILHPKLLAVWAREDFGLTKRDYESYVAVVKDLERLWEFLVRAQERRLEIRRHQYRHAGRHALEAPRPTLLAHRRSIILLPLRPRFGPDEPLVDGPVPPRARGDAFRPSWRIEFRGLREGDEVVREGRWDE